MSLPSPNLVEDTAHDLNNHLNVLFGYLGLIQKNTEQDAKMQEYTSQALQAVRYCAELVRKLQGPGRSPQQSESPRQAL